MASEKEYTEEPSRVSPDEGLILFDEEGDELTDEQEQSEEEDAGLRGRVDEEGVGSSRSDVEEVESEDLPEAGKGITAKGEEASEDESEEEESEEATEEGETEEEESDPKILELEKARDALTEDVKRLRARAQEAERANEQIRQRFETEDQQRAEAREREIQSKLESGELDPTEHEVSELRAELQNLREWREQEAVRQEALRAAPVIVQHETAFREQAPDYDDAVRFLHDQVRPQILAKGYPEWQVEEILAAHDFGFAVNQLNAGVNPGQAIYEAAVQKGYKPRPRDTSGTAENGSGQARGADPGSEAGEEGSRAQRSNVSVARAAAEAGVTGRRRSLSNSSGGVAPGGRGIKVTPSKFDAMEEGDKRQFLAWLDRNPSEDERFEVDGAVYWPAP